MKTPAKKVKVVSKKNELSKSVTSVNKLKSSIISKENVLVESGNLLKINKEQSLLTPKLKQKGIKRKIEESNTTLNSEVKRKRRRKNTKSKLTKQKKVKPVSKVIQNIENFEAKKVCKVVQSLLSILEEKRKEGNNELFGDEVQKITLQINSIKKPFCPTRLLRFSLPHPLYNDLSEICLFVADMKRVNKDIDKTVAHYMEKLSENKITNINKVLPLRALSTEYTQYEMQRKLANQFDIFLTDGRISHLITKRLGRSFAYTSKTPIPMNLQSTDWKNTIQNALTKTQMPIRSTSDSTSISVGTTAQSAQQVAENIERVCLGLAQKFPGGLANVRSLLIKTKNVPSLPLYFSIVSPNNIQIPVVRSIKAPKEEEVEGELTTMLDTIVKVKSDGTVSVHKNNRKMASELSDAEDDEIIKEAMKHKKQSKTVREYEGETDKDEENIIKLAERKVLKKLAKERSSNNVESDVLEENKDTNKLASEVMSRRTKKKLLKEANLKVKKPSKQTEKKAKTNWIKSAKKGAKKLSKDQRKALIKVKKAEKNKK